VYDPRMRRLLGGLFLASQSSVTGRAAVDGRFECESEVQKAISGRGQCWKEIAGARNHLPSPTQKKSLRSPPWARKQQGTRARWGKQPSTRYAYVQHPHTLSHRHYHAACSLRTLAGSSHSPCYCF
jgi:hypothetical protein